MMVLSSSPSSSSLAKALSRVGVIDGAVVDGGLIVEIAIFGDNLFGSRDDRMGLIEPEVEEKGGVGVAVLVEPGGRLSAAIWQA